jgi:small ligand-binding sensory domain FIST
MSVIAGAGLSAHVDPRVAATEAAALAAIRLAGQPADLALLFVSGSHLSDPEAVLDAVHGALAPGALVGCGAGGVLGGGRELESGAAVAVWAASFDAAGEVTPFHATIHDDGSEVELHGLPALEAARGAIVLPDPFSFPTDAVLGGLAEAAPAVPVLGGVSSARDSDGEAVLFFADEVRAEGAVGVRLDGIEMLPCVSQGAAPVGREVTITEAEGNVIHELAGRPALETIESVISELTPRERTLVAGGLLVGIVIDGGKPEYQQGDFLVRGLLGAEPESGRVAVGVEVRAGQVLRLHARDARSADEDLRRELGVRVAALAGRPPAGALVFSCNGRGRGMFGVADHDADLVHGQLRGAPTAGFFAGGEIGPVGVRSFLHSFTATVAVFPD